MSNHVHCQTVSLQNDINWLHNVNNDSTLKSCVTGGLRHESSLKLAPAAECGAPFTVSVGLPRPHSTAGSGGDPPRPLLAANDTAKVHVSADDASQQSLPVPLMTRSKSVMHSKEVRRTCLWPLQSAPQLPTWGQGPMPT